VRSSLVVAVACVAGVAGSSCSSKPAGKTVHVAAASDLTRAFGELGKAFAARTGIEPIIDFGSSGQLAKQIEQGAPYSVFAAASKDYVDQVVRAGKCDGSTAEMYSRGRLVVWTKGPAPKSLAELTDPKYRRISIANPDHAPYGKAAKQALESAGLWPQLENKIVLAESVQASMTYAREGTTDAALVALSLAVVDTSGGYLAVDPSLHQPLDQELVVCGQNDNTAAGRQFATFVGSPEGKEILTRYGFSLEGEKVPAQAMGAGSGSGSGV
jgi:molybdate transport system substrate-binding protein